MKKTRIAIFVSGGGTNLQAIIDYESEGKIPHGELALVLSSRPDAYALTRAEMSGIPTETVPRKMYDTQEKFEDAICKVLDEYQIDMIVLAGFMTILSEDFVKKFPRRIINVHPSLIPSFCGKGFYGLKVHSAALEYGVKVSGATVHFVNEVPDGGEIILQKAVSIRKGETPESLQQNIMRHAEWIILPRATEMVAKMLAKGDLELEDAE